MSVVELIKSTSDVYKEDTLRSLLKSSAMQCISQSEAQQILKCTSDAYKPDVMKAIKSKLTSMSGDVLCDVLRSTSDAYKSEVISACLPCLRNIVGSHISQIMGFTSDAYKLECLRNLRRTKPSIEQRDIVNVLSKTSQSYKSDVLAELSRFDIVQDNDTSAESIVPVKKYAKTSDSVATSMLNEEGKEFSTSCDLVVLQDAVKTKMGQISCSYGANRLKPHRAVYRLSRAECVTILQDRGMSVHTDDRGVTLNDVMIPWSYSKKQKTQIEPTKKSNLVSEHSEFDKTPCQPNDTQSNKKDTVYFTGSDSAFSRFTQFLGFGSQCTSFSSNVVDSNSHQPSSECVVCMVSVPTGAFVPCGHKVCCMECGPTQNLCPICRSPATQFIRVFE